VGATTVFLDQPSDAVAALARVGILGR